MDTHEYPDNCFPALYTLLVPCRSALMTASLSSSMCSKMSLGIATLSVTPWQKFA